MSYIRKMIERDNNTRLTVGCRASLKEGAHWAKIFEPGRHVILLERDSDNFTALVLRKRFVGKLTLDIKLTYSTVAWINENELKLVDTSFNTNLNFIDWYNEVKQDECPACGNHIVSGKEKCPGCGFTWSQAGCGFIWDRGGH